MFQLSHEVHVRATADEVWRTLVDFDRYPSWTRCVRLSGRSEVGGAVEYIIAVPQGRTMRTLSYPSEVFTIDRPRRLAWVSGLPWIMSLRFAFELEAIGAGVRVRHVVEVGGIGSLLARWRLQRLFSPSLERFLEDLRLRFAAKRGRTKSPTPPRRKRR